MGRCGPRKPEKERERESPLELGQVRFETRGHVYTYHSISLSSYSLYKEVRSASVLNNSQNAIVVCILLFLSLKFSLTRFSRSSCLSCSALNCMAANSSSRGIANFGKRVVEYQIWTRRDPSRRSSALSSSAATVRFIYFLGLIFLDVFLRKCSLFMRILIAEKPEVFNVIGYV